MRGAVIFVLAMLGLLPAYGQRVTPGFAAPTMSPGFAGGLGPGSRASHPFRGDHFPRSSFLLGAPWLTDFDTSVQPAAPAVVVVQPQPPAQSVVPEETRTLQPLLIEWQGDRFVRFEGTHDTDKAQSPANYVEAPSTKRKSVAAPPEARPLPATALVFRDGHREELESYTIVGGVMYLQRAYWQTGEWTKKVQLSELDVPATLKTNQERGVKFLLPSAPNEVVTRP